MPRPRPAVFLDRDDTILDTTRRTVGRPVPGDLTLIEDVAVLPGAIEALHRLSDLGYGLVVLSNQGGVARGGLSISGVEAINDAMRSMLGSIPLLGVYFCPFHPKGTVSPWNVEHPWRKPGPGMVLAAAEEHNLDLSRSWAIGDKSRDLRCAVTAGLASHRGILLNTTEDHAKFAAVPVELRAPLEGIRFADDLPSAVRLVPPAG